MPTAWAAAQTLLSLPLPGLAGPGAGEFGEALEALGQVQRQDWTADAGFAAWLARCYIMTGK